MKYLQVSLLIIIFQTIVFGQFDYQQNELPKDTLATVGSQVITAKDFLERFELMPWPKKDIKSRIELTKLEFLQSMVAEKLLAMEARQENIGNDSVTLSMQRSLERLFVRDEFYKREVLPKIVAPPEEINDGMKRLPFEVSTLLLGIVNQKEGELLYKKVTKSKNKDVVFNTFKDSLFVVLDTMRVDFGFSNKTVEDVVFSIGKDSISKPIELDKLGWVMFRLLDKSLNEKIIRLSQPDRLRKVEKIIKERKEDSIAIKVFSSVTASQKAEANAEIFHMLADTILAMMKADSATYLTKGKYILPSSDIAVVQKKLASRCHEPFVTIASGNMTLDEVLSGFGNLTVAFPSLQPMQFQIVLNNNIKTVIQNELLAREGLKKNLQQTESVRHDMSTWLDNRKSMLLGRSILDSIHISKEEIENEYSKHPEVYGATLFVRLKEILVDSVALALELRKRIDAKEDFSSLAKKYSKRKEWGMKDGESPWIETNKWGELGIYASNAKINEIVGPLRIKEGLTIFSVIERRVDDDSLRSHFSETSRSIEQKMLSDKQARTLDGYIGGLAKKYHVSLNEKALRKVETTTSSMFTWRNIGFGGRIMAVPSVIKQTDWVSEWMKQKLVNQ